MDENRLGRMEDKLDRLAEAMTSLVRMEERVITIFKTLGHLDEKVSKVDSRLTSVERTSEGRSHWVRFFDRLFWIILTATIAFTLAYLRPRV